METLKNFASIEYNGPKLAVLTVVIDWFVLLFVKSIRKFYEKEYKWLLDLNDGLTETILSLLRRERPRLGSVSQAARTNDWSGETWTDRHPWQKELSVLDTLFDS